jgi:hypothetical protein
LTNRQKTTLGQGVLAPVREDLLNRSRSEMQLQGQIKRADKKRQVKRADKRRRCPSTSQYIYIYIY